MQFDAVQYDHSTAHHCCDNSAFFAVPLLPPLIPMTSSRPPSCFEDVAPSSTSDMVTCASQRYVADGYDAASTNAISSASSCRYCVSQGTQNYVILDTDCHAGLDRHPDSSPHELRPGSARHGPSTFNKMLVDNPRGRTTLRSQAMTVRAMLRRGGGTMTHQPPSAGGVFGDPSTRGRRRHPRSCRGRRRKGATVGTAKMPGDTNTRHNTLCVAVGRGTRNLGAQQCAPFQGHQNDDVRVDGSHSSHMEGPQANGIGMEKVNASGGVGGDEKGGNEEEEEAEDGMGKVRRKSAVVEGLLNTLFTFRRNERERERVRFVNEGFISLRSRVPTSFLTRRNRPGKVIKSDRRVSKLETLRGAIRYIEYLRNYLDRCDRLQAQAPAAGLGGATHGKHPAGKCQLLPTVNTLIPSKCTSSTILPLD